MDLKWFPSFPSRRKLGSISEENEGSNQKIMHAVETGNISELEKYLLNTSDVTQCRDDKMRTPIHVAVISNRTVILQLLINHGCDVDAQDKWGNTGLHLAVENDSLQSFELLVARGTNTSLRNRFNQAPIHLAAVNNKINVFQVIIKHKDLFDCHIGGENGRTPLHMAAIMNNYTIVKILLSLTTEYCLKKTCDNGYTAVHEAARNSANETLEVMLQWGETMGVARQEIMKYSDSEGNIPLHWAVHGGDIRTVRTCLESGARMCTQQADLSTPIHLACSMGLLDIVSLMFTMQPEDKKQCLCMCDAQKMMPLHYAAMFDHSTVVKYLISEGANIDALDSEKRSPLLIAASRGAWRTARMLLRMGADIALKDLSYRNILHYVIMYEGNIEEFAPEMEGKKLCQLLNEKDMNGCTPLHYASKGGRLRSTESLLRLGACANSKNNYNESPLHFAARYGRYNTVMELLNGERGTSIINEADGMGLTPLHIASENGHKKVVRLLLAKGALLQRDHRGRTPFHLAAKNGYIQTMELLHSIHSHLVDQTDKDGNTPLHLAAKENRVGAVTLLLNLNCKILRNNSNQTPMDLLLMCKHSEAAMAMATHEERGYEILKMNSEKSEGIIQALIALMPEVYIAVLDRCIIKSNLKQDCEEYYIKYSFKYLQYSREVSRRMESKNRRFRPVPLPAMNTMVQYKRLELLCHPVCQKYIQMKWDAYGMYFHVANLVVYMVFVALLTIYSTLLMDSVNSTRHQRTHEAFQPFELPSTTTYSFNATVVLSFVIANCIKEMIQLYQQRLKYLLDPINLLEWTLYISAGIMVYPVFTGYVQEYHLACAAVTAFLAWFNFLLYLQRFDKVGLYVVMFLEILKTLIKALLIFSILFVAFGLAFYILMSRGGHLSFSNIPISIIRVFSMMLGEFDIQGTFIQPYFMSLNYTQTVPTILPFPEFSFGFLLLFMVSMPILLVNLLIGLAVGDIESVRRNAYLKRLAMQVELHTELERKLPQILLERVDKEEVIEYPNSPKNIRFKWFQPLLQKWFGGVYTDSSEKLGEYAEMSQQDDYIYEEMYKHKQKLKDVSASLESIRTLVSLIVQKMEIKTESNDWDEGDSNETSLKKNTKWASPAFRRKVRAIATLMNKNRESM